MKKTILSSLFCIVLLSGCATTKPLSQEQRDKLTSVSINDTIIVENAYQSPDGSTNPGTTDNMMAAGGGLIPALIGIAVDSTIMSRQQKKFLEHNEKYFAAVESAMPKNIDTLVGNAIHSTIATDLFFEDRIVEQADHEFISKVVQYGLIKTAGEKDEYLMSFSLIADVSLKKQDEKALIHEIISSTSTMAFSMKDYAENPENLEKVINLVIEDITNQLQAILNIKTAV